MQEGCGEGRWGASMGCAAAMQRQVALRRCGDSEGRTPGRGMRARVGGVGGGSQGEGAGGVHVQGS